MSFLSKIFSKPEPPQAAIDYSSVITDMHSHIIPGIDDGAQTIEDSMIIVKGLYNLGFRKLITTPHIMSDYYKNTPENINAGLEKVREAIAKDGLDITINAAAEYYLDEQFIQKLNSPDVLTFGNGYLLFETSYINRPENLYSSIFAIQSKGLKPVLAHPERYPFFYEDFDEYKKLHDRGVLLQLNTNSLTGYYSPAARMIAMKLIDNNLIDFIGTDCHHTKHLDALKHCQNEKYLRKIVTYDFLLNKSL
jgi:protein-tyrosine phosphatase